MNDLQRGVLTLLRSAITGEKLALPEGFVLEDAEEIIKRHHIATLAYTGAAQCGIPTNTPLMQKLFRQYCLIMMQSERQMQAAQRIFDAFDAAGIDYLPLKGCNMKALYPKPELRVMGDADILIRVSQYERIRPIMLELGFEEQVESDHELIWHSSDLHVELHKRLIPSYNKDYYAYFGDGWRLAKFDAGTRYTLVVEDDFVYQFTHFAKHYRDGGIGCRQVTDLWVYLRTYPDLDEAYIEAELRKLQLLEFYQNIRRLIGVWFDGAQSDERTEFITGFIFSGGSWGNWEAHVLSAEVKKSKAAGSIVRGRFKSILTTIFPPASAITAVYPILKKSPWLLPLIWPLRWIQVLLFRRKNLKIKSRELQIASADRIQSHQEALNYVGLDFHFE